MSRTAINKEAFVAALRLGLPEAMKVIPGCHPILHLSAHGSTLGIELSGGEVISWSELRSLLVPVNQGMNGSLLLCMSACHGYSACQMAMEEGDGPHPYYVMVGSGEAPTWSDTAVSYLTFYHLLSKRRNIPQSVAAMSAGSGVEWLFETAEDSKQYYLEFVKQTSDPEFAQKELETIAEREPLPANAKGLERGAPPERIGTSN